MNSTKGRVPHNYSTFDESLSYKKYMLLRYADYTPSFEMEGVPNDEIRVNTKDMIDSLSLNAPFKGTIRKIKESFKVPYMALLPNNWDQIYTQPSVGGDVPNDANTIFENFPSEFSTFWSRLLSIVQSSVPQSGDSDSVVAAWLTSLLRTLVVGEYVYSKGSLLNVCGYKASAQFEHLQNGFSSGSYDQFFDYVITYIFKDVRFFTLVDSVNNVRKIYRGLNSSAALYGVTNERFFGSFRSALDALRENPCLFVDFSDSVYSELSGIVTPNFFTDAASLVTNHFLDTNYIRFILPIPTSGDDPDTADSAELNPNILNYSRLLAYQFVYFHFYTNSSLDPVYSAELFRLYVLSLMNRIWNSNYEQTKYFTINGVKRPYDVFSGSMVQGFTIRYIASSPVYNFTYADLSGDPLTHVNVFRFAVLASIFATRHSLRYGDYFVGSRPRPLAPINTNVAVNNGQVSVIDITQKEWNQRFGNAVMRARQKVENYVEMLFGKKPDIDYHNPLFLSREVDVIFGDEVQNTAQAQTSDANSRTANMRGGLGQFTFTFHNDDAHPCVYIQIISFDIKRAYTRSVDRQFLIADRYDMFNPAFQYVGDQPIYGVEIGYPGNPLLANPSMWPVFGYTSRDMEYKQRFDVVCSGFEDNLPGWILTDVDRSRNHQGVLDADFIRNENSELDRFYISLTGYSLGRYFHFICITQNNVYAKRAMAVDPQILG